MAALQPPVKKLKTDVRRLDGMQRELYSLLGENTPPVAVVPDKFKSKPNWRQKVTPWQKVPFSNKARDDGVQFKHWVRGQGDPDEVYRFAHFNTKIKVPEWSDDDYQLFKSDSWTIEETQYLFDLCRAYDLRWLVIHDRYAWPKSESAGSTESINDEPASETPASGATPGAAQTPGEPAAGSSAATNESPDSDKEKASSVVPNTPVHPSGRTVEDLKERYYQVASALISKTQHLSPADEELLEQMKFPKEREIQRKTHLERLLSRSPAEVAEEEALVLESRRLEAFAERMLQERGEILRLLDSPASTGSIAAYTTSQGVAQLHQQLLAEKSRKPKEPVVAATTPRKEERKVSLAAQVMQKRLSAKEEAAYGISYQDKHTQGVYLRSTKLSTLKQSMAAKTHAVFQELGLPVRPVMPTQKVGAKFDSLQQSITVLLDAKRVQDRLEAEIKILKTNE